MRLPTEGLRAVGGLWLREQPEHLRPLPPLPAVPGWKHFPAETGCLLGLTEPFVLILVDISFHTLLNDPLQKDETEICFRRGEKK